jgi:hypothetical protein
VKEVVTVLPNDDALTATAAPLKSRAGVISGLSALVAFDTLWLAALVSDLVVESCSLKDVVLDGATPKAVAMKKPMPSALVVDEILPPSANVRLCVADSIALCGVENEGAKVVLLYEAFRLAEARETSPKISGSML